MRTCDTCGARTKPFQPRQRNLKTGALECPSCARPTPRVSAGGFVNLAQHTWAEGPDGDILLRPGHYSIAAIDDHGTWVEHEGQRLVLAETHVASEDYPVLSEILVDRPPLEREGSRKRAGWDPAWDEEETYAYKQKAQGYPDERCARCGRLSPTGTPLIVVRKGGGSEGSPWSYESFHPSCFREQYPDTEIHATAASRKHADAPVSGKRASQLTTGDLVMLDNEVWKVTAAKSSMGYTYVNFEHNTPASGQRAASWGQQYPDGYRFTLVSPNVKHAHDSGDGETIYHCFAGETRFWTRDGLQRLDEAAGTSQMVLTSRWDHPSATRKGGYWVEAEIRSFGEQPLLTVILSRNGIKKVVRATPEHRWFVKSGPKRDRNRVVLTADLQKGHRLSHLLPRSGIATTTPSPVGVQAGVVFGDGNRANKGSVVRLWGEKDAQLLSFFSNHRTTPRKTAMGVLGVEVMDLPGYFKDLPSLDESNSYLYGWLAGYFAADGSVSSQGQVVLTSAHREHLEFVEHLATLLGIGTYGIRSKERQGYGDEPTPLHMLEFVGSTLRPSFFLIQEHRDRFEARDYAYERLGWVVESVEDHGEVEEVFCAVVPDTESFVLEDWIFCSNCPFCGSGNVVGRSDGTVECAYCNSTFTVQVQPANANMPQTVDGQPYDIPGMPGQIDKPQPGDGSEPPSPDGPPAGDIGVDTGEDNPGPDMGEPPGQAGPPKPPGEDKPEDKKEDKPKGENPFAKGSARFITADGIALPEHAYVAHLAAKHGGRAPGRR